jgi:pimeloyl-ACP methyl ester carboxylesterase
LGASSRHRFSTPPARRRSSIAPDKGSIFLHRSHLSYPPDQTLSYDALLEVIEQQLRFEKEMVLIAESFSGPLAVRFAAAHPTRIKAVVLVASFVKLPVPR